MKTRYLHEDALCDVCGEPTCGHVAVVGDGAIACQRCLARSPGRAAEIAREFSDVPGLADEIDDIASAKWRRLAEMADLPF